MSQEPIEKTIGIEIDKTEEFFLMYKGHFHGHFLPSMNSSKEKNISPPPPKE